MEAQVAHIGGEGEGLLHREEEFCLGCCDCLRGFVRRAGGSAAVWEWGGAGEAAVEVMGGEGRGESGGRAVCGGCGLVDRRASAPPPAFCFVHAAQYLCHYGLSTMDEFIEQLRGCRREGEHVQVEIGGEGQLHVVASFEVGEL